MPVKKGESNLPDKNMKVAEKNANLLKKDNIYALQKEYINMSDHNRSILNKYHVGVPVPRVSPGRYTKLLEHNIASKGTYAYNIMPEEEEVNTPTKTSKYLSPLSRIISNQVARAVNKRVIMSKELQVKTIQKLTRSLTPLYNVISNQLADLINNRRLKPKMINNVNDLAALENIVHTQHMYVVNNGKINTLHNL